MKILVVTGIYPPQIGGPAQYAKNTLEAFKKAGHEVKMLTFGNLSKLPTGVRHFIFFLRALFALPGTDFAFALDTFSVAFPTVAAAKILGKKVLIRTGGDFLWESYVEETGDLVLLKDFYSTREKQFSLKQKIIFRLTGWTLRNASAVIFSTEWQRNIFTPAYTLDSKKNFIMENYYGPKVASYTPQKKNFIAGARALKWKNSARLKRVFERADIKGASLDYDADTAPYEKFLEKIQHSYAVVLPTLGDVSPNTILDAIRADKPFLLTRETGFYEKLKNVGVFVDPENEDDIAKKLLYLSDEKNYNEVKKKVEAFTFTHSWEQIADEIITIFKKVCAS